MKKHHGLLLQNIYQGQSCHLFVLYLPTDFRFMVLILNLCASVSNIQYKPKTIINILILEQYIVSIFCYVLTFILVYDESLVFQNQRVCFGLDSFELWYGARKLNCIDAVISTISLRDHFYPLTTHPFLLSRNCVITLSTQHIRCL